jgi:hypothetical protein
MFIMTVYSLPLDVKESLYAGLQDVSPKRTLTSRVTELNRSVQKATVSE